MALDKYHSDEQEQSQQENQILYHRSHVSPQSSGKQRMLPIPDVKDSFRSDFHNHEISKLNEKKEVTLKIIIQE